MNRFFDLKTSLLALVMIMVASCQKLKPEQVSIPEYPDLKELYQSQWKALGVSQLEKEVILDAKGESKVIAMDTSRWKEELSFLIARI